jgi:hypothetical protein
MKDVCWQRSNRHPMKIFFIPFYVFFFNPFFQIIVAVVHICAENISEGAASSDSDVDHYVIIRTLQDSIFNIQ